MDLHDCRLNDDATTAMMQMPFLEQADDLFDMYLMKSGQYHCSKYLMGNGHYNVEQIEAAAKVHVAQMVAALWYCQTRRPAIVHR